jgi:hypothetical protein
MTASKGRDRKQRATLESVSRKKKNPPLETIPPVNEAEFTEVIRKMVNTSPMTREEVEKRGIQRRKNPETNPRYLPVFDFSRPMKLSAKEAVQVRLTDEANREYRKKKKS